ncbi:MAG: N-acetylmuramoyl-L-alanine amidase [Deltaproteobacteria bacterium]|nr:N-acetylmuramoyl-L-alanine amidase [Deltaproteobacteria bacterium]
MRFSRTQARWWALLPALSFALTGCEHASEPAPVVDEPAEAAHGDHFPQEALSGTNLRLQWSPDGEFMRSGVLEAHDGATRVGLLMELEADAAMPAMEARGIDAAGEPGPWLPLEVTWQEDTQLVARADLEMDAVSAQLRMTNTESVASVIWEAVIPEVAEEVAEAEPPVLEGGAVGSTRSALRSDLAAVGVVSREEWGARSTSCSSNTDKYRMAIHHTVTPATSDPAVRVRGIQNFHIDSRGWCDIGYHFLVSLDGRMWEGRPLNQLGTHVGGENTGNIGISYIGCFQNSGCNDWTPFTPPDAMIDAGATLVREMSRIYGIAVNATNVKGHRDHAGASTSCPGDNLHALLPQIRERASGPSGPVWSAAYVDQSFPLARDPFVIPPGDEVAGYIELRNTGTDNWEPGATFLGTTEPRDGDSAIAGSDWVSPHRAATVSSTVAPGATGRFEFSVRGPTTAGDYPQYFNLVQEGVAWFSAPADDQLQVRVTVEMDAPPEQDMGTPPVMTDAGMPMGGGDMDVPGGEDLGPRPDGSLAGDGCGCRVTAPSESNAGGWVALLFVAFLYRRRFN